MTDPHQAPAKQYRQAVRNGQTDVVAGEVDGNPNDWRWIRSLATTDPAVRHTTTTQWVDAESGRGHALRAHCTVCGFISPAVPEHDKALADEVARQHETSAG